MGKNKHRGLEHTSFCGVPPQKMSTLKVNLLQHHADTFPADMAGKARTTLCIWECGVPPVLPSTHARIPLPSAGGFLPRPVDCSPLSENRASPTYHHVALAATGSLEKTKQLSQQSEIHGNLCLLTVKITLLQKWTSLSGVT